MEYKVTDENLTSIANAIRSKSGTTTGITFPGGFIDDVANIPVVPIVDEASSNYITTNFKYVTIGGGHKWCNEYKASYGLDV